MGWQPAQQAAGIDWLYPYLIYTLTDSYAAVRFDAWKSLQTLPSFSDFSFTYTMDDRSLESAAELAMGKWARRVRPSSAVFESQTLLDDRGRFQQDEVQRLRNERDERRIFLAE